MTTQMTSLFEAVTSIQPINQPEIPEEVRVFEQFKNSDAFKKLSFETRITKQTEFHTQESVKKYYDDKWKAQLSNRDAIWWLCEYRDNYKPSDNEKKAIDQKLIQFMKFIRDQKDIYPALRVNKYKLKINNLNITKVDWHDEEENV
jgi:hypothetical protein